MFCGHFNPDEKICSTNILYDINHTHFNLSVMPKTQNCGTNLNAKGTLENMEGKTNQFGLHFSQVHSPGMVYVHMCPICDNYTIPIQELIPKILSLYLPNPKYQPISRSFWETSKNRSRPSHHPYRQAWLFFFHCWDRVISTNRKQTTRT